MSLMQTITTGRENRPPRLIIYGSEGVGKSTWGAKTPNPIFIQTEDGLAHITTSKFPLCTDLDEVIAQLEAVRDEEHSFQTLVVDSLDWLERLIWDRVCQEFGVRNIEKADGGYGKGYSHALTHWRKVIALLSEIRDRRNMAIVLIAHSKVERFEDPENAAYDRYSPRLHKHASALLCEWADAVLFATRRIRVDKEAGKAAPIGKDGGERIIRAVGSPACVAKNRYGMPEELPLSWDAVVNAIAEGARDEA